MQYDFTTKRAVCDYSLCVKEGEMSSDWLEYTLREGRETIKKVFCCSGHYLNYLKDKIKNET